MARITGFVIGEMRGKLGGLVFARNARGAYARAFVSPVNPNTEAQALARNAFSSAVGGWHVLTDAQKALWSDYATQYFSSKKLGNIGGGHSGINAFVSLRNTLLNVARKAIAAANLNVEINGTPVTVITQSSVILPTVPPSQPFQPILGSGDYAIDSVGTTTLTTTLAGEITFNLVYTGGSGPTPTPPSPTSANLFEDNNGSTMGIAIFASNALAQESQFVQNPNIYMISNTGLISGYTTTPAVPSSLTIEIDGSIYTGYKKTTWGVGQALRLDAWLYNSYGESTRVGTTIVTLAS